MHIGDAYWQWGFAVYEEVTPFCQETSFTNVMIFSSRFGYKRIIYSLWRFQIYLPVCSGLSARVPQSQYSMKIILKFFFSCVCFCVCARKFPPFTMSGFPEPGNGNNRNLDFRHSPAVPLKQLTQQKISTVSCYTKVFAGIAGDQSGLNTKCFKY